MSSFGQLDPVNDDTIQCWFFSPKLGTDRTLWEDLCKQINDYIKSLCHGYIWHRDEFHVFVPIVKDNIKSGAPLHLSSNTCFGDNIEDEWFIIYVVLEISKKYNDLIIQVKDNDGDFLLIEAANYLQSWANPENTENRVFIHNHHIHIIPPEVIALEPKLGLDEALEKINNLPELTQATHNIEQAILNRIGPYPDKISDNIHRTIVKLPTTLAAILTLQPSLISPIVDSYCYHDIVDAKACKKIDFNDCVDVEVKFTKFLYATLVHSKLINQAKYHGNDKKTLLGLKLMCGYQMLMNKASVTDPLSSKEYQMFLQSLKQNGYFRNNIEGSTDYQQLLERAQHYFSVIECPVRSNVFFHSVTELMKTNEFTRLENTLKSNSGEHFPGTEDNEDWLNINPEELNDLLFSRYGKMTKLKNIDDISSQTLTQELSSFLKQTSDFEGIEQGHIEESDSNEIEFESDQFVSCIEKMLKVLSTHGKENTENIEGEEDSDDEDEMFYNDNDNDDDDDSDDCDEELKLKLQNNPMENLKDKSTIMANIMQSIKEEKASTGPTSNLLRSIGVTKPELLDSDDD